MTTVRELHDEAMKLSHLALVARETGDFQRAENLARQALTYEAEAASLVPDGRSSEPTRSILYRSAASLAYQCKDFYTAQQLIAKGLSGYPPARVEQELKMLLDQVNFEHYLQSHGVDLDNEEVGLAMKGNAVGYGTIVYHEFNKRIEAIFHLVDRTVQRKMGRDYQRSGRISQMYKPFTQVLSGFAPGSFTVKLKLGQPELQQQSFLINTSDVIGEIIQGIELLSNYDEDALRELIQSEGYYHHFISMARELAPDGDQIQFVAFSSNTKIVNITRSRDKIDLTNNTNQDALTSSRTLIKVEGVLDHATSRRGDMVGLTTAEGVQYDITIKEGFDDLVRSYFKKYVIITGLLDGKMIEPTDIHFGDQI